MRIKRERIKKFSSIPRIIDEAIADEAIDDGAITSDSCPCHNDDMDSYAGWAYCVNGELCDLNQGRTCYEFHEES